MGYGLVFVLGILAGGTTVFGVLAVRRGVINKQARQTAAKEAELAERTARLLERETKLATRVGTIETEFKARAAEFEARVISYNELRDENLILKRDLQNIDVNLRKMELDVQVQHEEHIKLDARCRELGVRHLKDSEKWIGASLSTNNYVNCKQRLKDVIERCRGVGLAVSPDEEMVLFAALKADYEKIVRAALEREEQARIKAQIREEQLREREIDRELKQLDRERAAIRVALEKALAETNDKHSAEIERLQAKLSEAEEKSRRVMSQAQLTKAGHVYVVSNLGSLGDGIFKIGMTRRLEPLDRVRELSDASVPFPFDVHMMISSDDAPKLENALHRKLHRRRLNKVNPRKEFFRSDIEAIREIVEQHHGEVRYIADAEALEFRQSMTMTDDDQEFIEEIYNAADEESGATGT